MQTVTCLEPGDHIYAIRIFVVVLLNFTQPRVKFSKPPGWFGIKVAWRCRGVNA